MSRPQVVHTAVSQALDYRDLITQDSTARDILKSKGIDVWCPQIIIVSGRHKDIDPKLFRTLIERLKSHGNLEVLSYNNIFKFAKDMYQNSKLLCVPATYFNNINSDLSRISQTPDPIPAWNELIKKWIKDLANQKFPDRISVSDDEALVPKIFPW